MDQHTQLQLHDIKTIVEVQEYSLYYLIALSVLVIVIVIGLIYILLKWYKNKNRFNLRKEHFKLLKNLDLTDAKNASYAITFYGSTFKDDTKRNSEK